METIPTVIKIDEYQDIQDNKRKKLVLTSPDMILAGDILDLYVEKEKYKHIKAKVIECKAWLRKGTYEVTIKKL